MKAPYGIKVTCPSPLVAACSGTQVGSGPGSYSIPLHSYSLAAFEEDGRLTYEFKQVNPIPGKSRRYEETTNHSAAYLIAIVCGALKRAAIGPRSHVWTERELLESSVHEFSEVQQ